VRIAQAVSNVLNNAAKFTPRDGRVTLTATCEEGIAEIRVRDTGMGIAPAMLEGIFDLFVQGEPRDGMARGGLGIGLTLVKRFVELHGGTVEALSEGPGRGTEIVMRLPCVIRKGESAPCASDEDEERRIIPPAPLEGLGQRVSPS
jgi:signal transduction histidine kinase